MKPESPAPVVGADSTRVADPPVPLREQDFRHLPERVPFEQMTTGQPASDPPSPDFGRDPDHEWMLRFGAS